MNAAKSLWYPPRYDDLKLPNRYLDGVNSQNVEAITSNPPATPKDCCHTTIDTVLSELREFFTLPVDENIIYPLANRSVMTCDTVSAFERRLVTLIHSPPASHTSLDTSCSIAALMATAVFVGKLACASRLIEISRLQNGIEQIGDDLSSVFREPREREKLLWVVGFGAVRSCGDAKSWFVKALAILCNALGLKSWEDMRAALVEVLWKDDLDEEGKNLWRDMEQGHYHEGSLP